MSGSLRKRHSNMKSRRRDELLKILEEVKALFNSDNNNEFDSHDCVDNDDNKCISIILIINLRTVRLHGLNFRND